MSAVTPSFPPRVTLASALNASNPSVLAAKAFADPDTGYPTGLRLAGALSDNQSGHFSLASGLTLAGNAAGQALNALKDFQASLSQLYNTAARLRDSTISQDTRESERVKLGLQLEDLKEILREADLDEFNLLDATHSDGVKLDVKTGAFRNLGKTPEPNGAGSDQRFAYSPNSVSFRTTDIAQAIDDLGSLALETYPDTAENLSTGNSIDTVARFKNTLDQAAASLKTFQKSLAQTASDGLTVAFSSDASGGMNGSDARQIASRLAQALHNDSFNLSASVSSRFFSLFA